MTEEIQKLEEESDIRISRHIPVHIAARCGNRNWMDYDDQMLYAYKMLRMDQQTVLEHFQNLISIYLRG